MDNVIITVLILASVSGVYRSGSAKSVEKEQNSCLYSRLDYIPCIYRNRALERAGENQYTIHHTRLRHSASGFLECNVRTKGQVLRNITDLGTENVKILFSPGFYQEERYDDRLLVEYKVQCAEGRLAYFNITEFEVNIQTGDCVDEDGNKKCEGSLIIDLGDFGTTEVCGRTLNVSGSSYLNQHPQSLRILFRTGEFEHTSDEETRGKGFQMYVICFKDEPLEDCFRPSDFDDPVCNIASSEGGSRKRRHAYEDEDGLTYRDFFTGYPSGMKIRKDVADFHNQWHRLKRQAGRFIERNILFNESVNYIDNEIIIYDIDDNIVDIYSDIYVLQTFNTTGGITTYISNVESDLRPHFASEGPLIITGRYAYFQLFVIDPRLLAADPQPKAEFDSAEEELTTLQLIEPLLNAVLENEDTNHIIESNLTFSDDGVFDVLRNVEACNPIVRTLAQSSLKVYNMTDSVRLQELLNFIINCTLQSNELECVVDGPTAVLPNNTTCQINNEPPMKCDPFYEPPVTFSDDVMIMNITVRAINCNGQRAKQYLDKDGKQLDCY